MITILSHFEIHYFTLICTKYLLNTPKSANKAFLLRKYEYQPEKIIAGRKIRQLLLLINNHSFCKQGIQMFGNFRIRRPRGKRLNNIKFLVNQDKTRNILDLPVHSQSFVIDRIKLRALPIPFVSSNSTKSF